MKRSPVTLLFATVALSMVAASASDAMPLSPSDMTSALERKIVSGAGVMYPGSDLESATTPALALLDAEWPAPFLDRIGETISVRVSSTTGCYEFTDESRAFNNNRQTPILEGHIFLDRIEIDHEYQYPFLYTTVLRDGPNDEHKSETEPTKPVGINDK